MQRLTERAVRAVQSAVEEARLAGSPEVRAEHLLLAVLGMEDSIACRALARLGVRPGALAGRVRQALPPGEEKAPADIPFSPPAKAALAQHALAAAQELGHHYVGTEHLLLGLVRGGGAAAQVLADSGVDGAGLAGALRQVLEDGGS